MEGKPVLENISYFIKKQRVFIIKIIIIAVILENLDSIISL